MCSDREGRFTSWNLAAERLLGYRAADVIGRDIGLRPNRDLPYLNERFEAGQLIPVIDGPYTLSDAREAFRRFGAGNHQGKIVFTIE